MSEDRYMALVEELVLRFPKQEISEASQAAYALDLEDLPYEELRHVCRQLWRTEEWFPSIAKIRETWCELTLKDTVMTEGQATEWMIRAVNRIGGPGPFPDPVVREMVRLVTFERLTHMPDDDWTRKELSKAYQQARQTISRQVMAGELPPPPVALPDRGVPALKVVGS
jgi:hypothetical protein